MTEICSPHARAPTATSPTTPQLVKLLRKSYTRLQHYVISRLHTLYRV